MRILVTGGGGFIGGMVVRELLKRGHKVTVFGHSEPEDCSNIEFIYGDILEEKDLAKLGQYDGTIHMAGILGTSKTFENIKTTAMVNIIGTINMLERQKQNGFFIQPNLLGTWLNPYMISKHTAERFGQMFGTYYPVKYISLRFTDTFGPQQSTKHGKAIPSFIANALANKPLQIYGTGNYVMRLLYVKDAAKIICGVVEKWEELPSAIDVCSDQLDNQIAVRYLAAKIIRLLKSSSTIEYLPMRIGQPKHVDGYDVDEAQSRWLFDKLGVTETPHNVALKETIDWYKNEKDAAK